MSDLGSSPEVEEVAEEEVEEVEDKYEGGDKEHFHVINELPECVIDEDLEGEGDVEEEEKLEGLDLDIVVEDGVGYQDHDEIESLGHQNELQENARVAAQPHEVTDANAIPEMTIAEVCNGEEDTKERSAGMDAFGTQSAEPPPPLKEIPHMDRRLDESKDDPLSRPEHGSEVFVGNISKDTVEGDLRDLCTPCGDIFEVRVMRDKDKDENSNKGFAFVTFTNKEYAQKTIETLNNYELKGRKLRFSSSLLKNKLLIGNIPKTWDKEELEKALTDKCPGVRSIEPLKRDRGIAVVEYYNHACAEHSRRLLSTPGFKLGENSPSISWADSSSTSDLMSSSQVKVVYVRNLPDSVTQEQLWKLFEHHGEIAKVVLPQSKPGQLKRDFGFIHFTDRSSALKAIEKSEKYELDGRELEASLAKPPGEKRLSGAAISSSYGLLPPGRTGLGIAGPGMYGGMATGFGASRGLGQVQPLIYGRGPTPAGMAMVPMMLPDGRLGYVLQQANAAFSPSEGSYARENRGSSRGSQSQKQGGSSSRRYKPY